MIDHAFMHSRIVIRSCFGSSQTSKFKVIYNKKMQTLQRCRVRGIGYMKVICPKCKSEHTAPIMYGYPTPEAWEASERGEIILDARHLYDVYNMGNSWVKESAFKRKKLLEKDITFKQKFYYAKSAHYEIATLGSIMLVPGERIHKALKEDYQAMHHNMIYGKMPEYEELRGDGWKLEEEVHDLE